jgi:hypothetical protein
MAKTTIHLTVDLDVYEAIQRNPNLTGRISTIVNEFLRNLAFESENDLDNQKIKIQNDINDIKNKLKILEGININIDNKLKDKTSRIVEYNES